MNTMDQIRSNDPDKVYKPLNPPKVCGNCESDVGNSCYWGFCDPCGTDMARYWKDGTEIKSPLWPAWAALFVGLATLATLGIVLWAVVA